VLIVAAVLCCVFGLGCEHPTVRAQPAHKKPAPPPAPAIPYDARTITVRLGTDHLAVRDVTIVLPETFDADASYPVLVVFDGQHIGEGGFDLVRVLDRLAREGRVPPHVVVGVASTEDRTAEYTFSRTSYEHLRDRTRSPAVTRDQRLADFVVEDVLPMVAVHANIETDRANGAALGFSYGGLAAIHLALRWPERFGRVIGLSPSLWWSARRTIAEFASYRGPSPVRMWIDVGTLEGRPRDIVPYMVGDARALVRAAELRGMKLGEDLGYLEIPNEDHDTGRVRHRLESALGFALSDRIVDLDDAQDGSFLVFAPVLRGSQVTSFTLALDLEQGLRMTAPLDRVSIAVRTPAVVRADGAGHLRMVPGAEGTSTVVARFGRVEEDARVRVMR
jgi:predicted alpha/beta superfamily hydrolase